MNNKDFKWTEKRFGLTFANILKKLGGLSKNDTDGSIEYKDEQGNVTKLVTDSNFGSLLAKNGLIEITWQELKDKRDNGQLIPGSLYRITDYNCTTVQENTRSAGHQFDIVLLALSKDKLAEEGWAMMHDNIYDVTFADGVTKKCYAYFYTNDGDNYANVVDCVTMLGSGTSYEEGEIEINEQNKTMTYPNDSSALITENLTYNYFQNSNLSAWKVWYCLDNDKSRFAWADGGSPAMIEFTYDDTEVTAKRNTEFDRDYNGESYFAWSEDGYDTLEYAYFTKDASPATHSILYFYAKNKMSLLGAHTSNYQPPQYNGRGVIYRLIDEWGNDVGYDFKNIQFVRPMTDGEYDEQGEDTWVYTFSRNYNGTLLDGSTGDAENAFYFCNKITRAFDLFSNVFFNGGSDSFVSSSCKELSIDTNGYAVTCYRCVETYIGITGQEGGAIYINNKKVLTES